VKSKERVTKNQEIFTPKWVVDKMLDEVSVEVFKNKDKTFADIACGDGNILVGILERRLQSGIDPETALYTLHGFDIMEDNVDMARNRLKSIALGSGQPLNETTVDLILLNNIKVVDSSLTYDFDTHNPL
jgi:ubiquinone/menaquinone biosynthesis C-methylase UbiE